MRVRVVCLVVVVLWALHHGGADSPIHCQPIPGPATQLLQQPVDHQAWPAANNATFGQQYWTIDNYYKKGGPMLFMVGAENAQNVYTLIDCSALVIWAQQLAPGALVVGAEHRGFGKSIPSAGHAADFFPFVNLDNVLADYAAVIDTVRNQYQDPDMKVVTFGGSYGGFLSYAMRVRHPDVVHAAVSSAGPSRHLYDVGEAHHADGLWYDTVQDIYTDNNPQCAQNMQKAFAAARALASAGQWKQLASNLGLCCTPKPAYLSDLFTTMMHAAQVDAQFSYPFAAAASKPFSFNATCDAFVQNPFDAFHALRVMMDIGLNSTHHPQQCLWPKPREQHRKCQTAGTTTAMDHNQLDQVNPLDHMHLLNEQARALLPAPPRAMDISFELTWYYITCTYYVFPVGASPRSRAFFSAPPQASNWTFSNTKTACAALFQHVMPAGRVPVPSAHRAISLAEIESSSNILFTRMGLDPVRTYCEPKDLNATRWLNALDIAFVGHTLDIIGPTNVDPFEVTRAREQELKWLQAVLASAEDMGP